MAVEVVAWDVYDTIIAPYHDEVRDDMGDEPLKLLPGVKDCLEYLDSGCFQVTCSDGDTGSVKRDLTNLGVLEFFVDFFHMTPYVPKDFTGVCDLFGYSFEDILVIGNDYKIDIELAGQQGCKTLHVPLGKQLRLEQVVKLVG